MPSWLSTVRRGEKCSVQNRTTLNSALINGGLAFLYAGQHID